MTKRGICTSYALLTMLGLGFLSSCQREQSLSGHSLSRSEIGFAVEAEDAWELHGLRATGATLASHADQYRKTLELEGQQSADKAVYLHVFERDGIEGSPSMPRGANESLRGRPVGNETMYGSFGLFASAYPAAQSFGAQHRPNYIYNVEVSQANSYKTNYYWPGAEERLSFFAYAPYNGAGLTFSSQTEGGAPQLRYTVPQDVSKQHDLLVACNKDVAGDKRAVEALRFAHALTAVRFSTGTGVMPGAIKAIRLKGVNSRGVYTFGATWTGQSSPTDYSYTADIALAQGEQKVLNGGEYTFMMLPQTLPSGAMIEVDYQVSGYTFVGSEGNIRTLRASIAGDIWPEGKTLNYRISLSSIAEDYVFALSEVEANFDYEGNPLSTEASVNNARKVFRVTSTKGLYSRTGENALISNELNVPWGIEYSTDKGGTWSTTRPDGFLRTLEVSQQGSSDMAIQLDRSVPVAIDEILREAPSLSAERDLSMGNPGTNGQMTTANCYIINQAGRYKFPLMYGNGMKNGVYNPSAYNQLGFKDHFEKSILRAEEKKKPADKDPDLSYTWGSNLLEGALFSRMSWKDARLLWESSPGLIEKLELDRDNGYIKFAVNKNNIRQGNAVIALYAKRINTPIGPAEFIIWSWHIWVTPVRLDETEEVGGYRMMRTPLGWVEQANGYHRAREVWMRLTQSGSNKALVVKLKQQKQHNYYGGAGSRSVQYQWGRKDPLAHDRVTTSSEAFTLGKGILQPQVFFKASNNWQTLPSYLWDNNGAKTIYDPSPVGFRVPGVAVFMAGVGTRKEFLQRFAYGWWNIDEGTYIPDNATDKWTTGSNSSGNRLFLKWDDKSPASQPLQLDKSGAHAMMVQSVAE